jgi:S1-C subfamily serine protease
VLLPVVGALGLVAAISLVIVGIATRSEPGDAPQKASTDQSATVVAAAPEAAVILSGEDCTDENAIRLLRPTVVRIETRDGVGTGIIIGANEILTNAHVVEGSTSVQVSTVHGVVSGTVIGRDENLDLALVQAPTANLATATLGSEHTLKAGQRLLALGFALDLEGEPSSTGGIFSAVREADGESYVQTDTPINPGNSGGPLFTNCGEVMGINTVKPRGTEGIGFAIGASTINQNLVRLRRGG